ncbi:MAG: endopeptidase La [Candidatus Methanomethylophilaceae archaeon]|nr:endopeptidase La [Candidatus Methanomethylophilaceae archaeon]
MRVIPLYNYLVLPNALTYVPISSIEDPASELELGARVVLICAKDSDLGSKSLEERFYPIGVTGTIIESDIQGYVAVATDKRVNIDVIAYEGDGLAVTYSDRASEYDLSDDERHERFIRMKAAITKMMSKSNAPDWWKNYVNKLDNIEKLTVASSIGMNIDNAERYAVLAIDSEKERSERMEQLVMEMVEISELNIQSRLDQNNRNQKAVRESAIRHQMEFLQKQLDELDPDGMSEIGQLEKRIEESGMNETAYKEAMKALNRMKQDGQNGHEYGTLYDYIDFLTSLSWKSDDAEEIDLEEAERILDEEHFGLKKIKDRIIQQIAVMNLNRKQYGTILLFVGAPGTGKTSIGQSIAKALNRKYVRVSLGGVRDEADIRGHRRTYIGAMPGRIMDGIQKSGSSNPVMVLDEVDKLSVSYNGDPASALLEVLDPEQNGTFTDHYMNVPYDLSKVMFICTANTIETIPEPLLNRMEVIHFPGYTPTDKKNIARKHLIPKAMESMGISEDDLEIEDSALESIISDYTMETGVRGLKKRIDTLCRIAAVNLVKGKNEPLKVTTENLRGYMDSKPVRHGRIIEDTKPGIVTGLAWTAAGGDILFIESSFMPGKGDLVLTGQLGDVMQESVKIAVSLVKQMFPKKADLFKENDLHIHVPEGAVKKDGPSAGITITTALASLVTGKTVKPEFGMTGEVSLRGRVMPIGGLPEKLMAAQRAGVRTVFIPKDNVDDLEDVADEVKEKLEIIPVTEISEVLKKVGIRR